MSFAKWDPKDPDEVLDYVLNWATDESGDPGRTAGDTITSSAWNVPTGITKDSDSFTAGTTTIWLSGGTAGETYTLTNHVITSGGRHHDQSVILKVKVK